MILLLFLVVGFVIGLIRGGGLSGLAGMHLRAVWLVLLSAIAQLVITFLPIWYPQLFPGMLPVVQVVRYVPLFLFVFVNYDKWRIWVICLGIGMNFAAISANDWRMPVSWNAAPVQQPIVEYRIMKGYADANIWYLSDIIPVFPENKFASAGDFVLGFGVLLIVQHGMARYSSGRHARGSLARHPKGKVLAVAAGPGDAEATNPVVAAAPAPPEPERIQTPQPSEEYEDCIESTDDDETVTEKPDSLGFLPMSGPFPDADTDRVIPIRLTPRLEAIALMIDRRAVVADIGCDHGKLSAYLALSGSPKVIAVDASAKSLGKTRQLVKEMGLQQVVQTRVADGLKKLKPGEADVIVIAGLGGPAIAAILDGGLTVANSALKLIVQPMNAVGMVRRWIVDNGFCIIDEQLAEEDDRIYQILAAEPGSDCRPPMSLFDLEIGWRLVDQRHPLLGKLLESRIATIDWILSEITDNTTPKADARRNELIDLRGRCSEVLEWIAR